MTTIERGLHNSRDNTVTVVFEPSDSLYESNRSLLITYDPSLDTPLKTSTIDHTSSFVLEKTHRQDATLKVFSNGLPYYLYSRYDPICELEKYFNAFMCEEEDIVVFLGFGLGYHAREFMKRYGVAGTVIIVEQDISLLTFLCSHVDFSFLSHRENVIFLAGKNITQVQEFIRQEFLKKKSQRILTITTPSLVKMNELYYARLLEFLDVYAIRASFQKREKEYTDMVQTYFTEKQFSLTEQSIHKCMQTLRARKDFSLRDLSLVEVNLILLYQILYSQDFGFTDEKNTSHIS
jgi:hypothetical protein